jgi:branched-chain amino acid transport system ATP-binding protein
MTAPSAAPVGAETGTGLVLEARGVVMRFGGLTALADVGLQVAPRAVTGLVGPNGAGKTTLFGVLSGLLRPTAGKVFLAGKDVTNASPQVRARMGLARTFQQPELFAGLSVRDHLVLADRLRHEPRRLWTDLVDGRAWRRPAKSESERVNDLMEMLGITDIGGRAVLGLPLGMRRLLEVGRALATGPKVVLLDEPSSGLDRAETARLGDTLKRIVVERAMSFVMVEHDVDLVLGLSERVFVLDFGSLIAEGTPDEIRAAPAVRAAYLGDEPIPGVDDGAEGAAG